MNEFREDRNSIRSIDYSMDRSIDNIIPQSPLILEFEDSVHGSRTTLDIINSLDSDSGASIRQTIDGYDDSESYTAYYRGQPQPYTDEFDVIEPHGVQSTFQDESYLTGKQISTKDFTDPSSTLEYLPIQRRNIIAKQGSLFTLMVAGETGLGKSTFINTLFEDNLKKLNHPSKRYKNLPSDGPIVAFNRTSKIEIQEAEYEELGFTVKFTIIDTPGFGDYTNNNHSWVPIVNYIDDQLRLYMLQEEQPDRTKLIDTRVHACLYFIRPSGHGLLPLDIKVMQELSRRVNLIPVISKADSFTPADLSNFKSAIFNAINANGIQIYRRPISDNGTGDDDQNSPIHDLPYAVIGSDKMFQLPDGTKVRGRQYQWGIAQVNNEDHCDFNKLRNVLMSKNMLDLIDTTIERHYERFRRINMQHRIFKAQEELGIKNIPIAINPEGGTDAQLHISKFGLEFLQSGQLESDPIFNAKETQMKERFEVILAFQETKFEQWKNELKNKQDELNIDIEELHRE